MTPGIYRARDGHCWTSFTLYLDGRVEHVDARDGHVSYWHVDPSWVASMKRMLASGELIFEGGEP